MARLDSRRIHASPIIHVTCLLLVLLVLLLLHTDALGSHPPRRPGPAFASLSTSSAMSLSLSLPAALSIQCLPSIHMPAVLLDQSVLQLASSDLDSSLTRRLSPIDHHTGIVTTRAQLQSALPSRRLSIIFIGPLLTLFHKRPKGRAPTPFKTTTERYHCGSSARLH
ncbi:hypothetical protein NM208_g13550 [Fusarium decemcellulare]|uniref:Uncharacterized protein n=1 Tax=Fusarium decemcellulare TaxID=57161 RepID=A0ACC1RMX5_9HYPO|nr:hypothetical protein NM208_g13550 [Fusarium decemcellulare]